MKTMTYKDYAGSAEVSVEDGVLYGKLLGIRDLVTYEADTPAGLKAAFVESVDDYLADCAEEGREPDRPFKGTFNVRIGAALHRQVALEAFARHMSLNDLIVTKVQVANVVQHAFAEVSADRAQMGWKRVMAELERLGATRADPAEHVLPVGTPKMKPAKRSRHAAR